jgi:hypothetical protein
VPTATSRPAGPFVLAGVAGLAHLLVGYLYLASGLVVPGYALVPLWIWWAVQAWFLVRLARRSSWWTPLVPLVALTSWWLVLTLGESLLGWRG